MSDIIESVFNRLQAETARLRHRPHRAFNKADVEFAWVEKATCYRCEGTFYTHKNRASYCSPACQQADRNDRRREARAQEREQRERRRKPGHCAVCDNKLVDQVRSTLRYCSNACRQQAYRQRME